MNLYYRSESSSSLTNEQIDSNFRTLDENKSITGSYTISGNLLPVDPNNSLGSNEQPWKDLYISPDSIIFVSGSVSHSTSYPLETKIADFEFGLYSPDSGSTGPNPFSEGRDVFVEVNTSDFGSVLKDWNNTPGIDSIINVPPSGSPSGSLFPNGTNNIQNWWDAATILDNGGGFGIGYAITVVGAEWLDRSRHYGIDGFNNSGSAVSGSGRGKWQTNHSPRNAISGKTSVIFDNTYPRLWQFSAEAGWWGNAFYTYAQTNGEPFASTGNTTSWGTEKNKAHYFNLLVSGSAYDLDPTTGELVRNNLEMPPYDDGDILVRMWNDNLPYWSYWSKLEYGEENVIHYNVSESNDPLGGPYPIYHQSSSNPGRIKLINNYNSPGRKWQPTQNSRTYEYEFDYNPVDPFISSSNLMLSLKMMAGPYVQNPLESQYWGTPPKHVLDSGFCLGNRLFQVGYSVSGSGRIQFYNKKQYGVPFGNNGVVLSPTNPFFSNTRLYVNTSSIANLYTASTNEEAGLDGIYPSGAYSSQMIWDQLDQLPSVGYKSLAYGYNQTTNTGCVGDCAAGGSQGMTWAQIHPIIPLTTAHYPLSASYFWITSSYSNDTLTFRKPNDRVGSPSLYTLPFVVTASSNPLTIYDSNSTISSNRTVDLNGFDLIFDASNGETFSINASSSSEISITGLSSSNSQTLLSYNNSDGTLGILSTTSIPKDIQPYYYSTGSTNDNAEVTNDIKLELGLVYDYDNGINLDNSIYEVNIPGKYYINVNGTLGEDGEPSSNGLGWWKVALQVNGTTVAESTAKQSEVGEHYGGLDLMYVGDFSVNDTIQLLSDTSPSSATSSISNTTYRFSAEYLGA